MTSIASLRMEIQTGDVTRAARELDKMTDAGGRAETATKKLTSSAGGAAQAMSFLRGAVAGIGAIELGRQLIGAADAMTLLDARLRLATKGAAEYAQAQAEIYRISQGNQVGLQETATLYTRLADPVRRLGGSARETSAIVEAFATSLRLSGASTGEAASATLQFSQAMASGALRGEEFNSINEAAPRLMRALAEGLGVTTGELRGMAAEGQLTAGVVGNALAGSLQTLQSEASQMPLTVGGAMQQVANETMVLVGRFNDATGASGSLANMVSSVLTPTIRALYSVALGVVEVFRSLGTTIGGVLASIAAILRGEFSEAGKIMAMVSSDVSASWERAGAAINQAWEPAAESVGAATGALGKLTESAGKTEPALRKTASAQAALNKASREAAEIAKEQARREQEALDASASIAMSRLRRYEEAEAAADQQLRSAQDMVAAIELETRVMGMSNVERETTLALLALEKTLVGDTAYAYEQYAAQIKEAIAGREAKRSGIESMRALEQRGEQMADQIGQSLSDALMGGGRSAADYIEGLFRNLVLRPALDPVGRAVSGAFSPSGSSSGGGSNSGSAGMLGQIAGISGAFGTGLTSSFASMGAAGVGGWASAAGSLMGSGSLAGAAAGAGMVAAPLLAAYALYSLLSSGGEKRAGGGYGYSAGGASFGSGMGGLSSVWSDEVAGSLAAGQTRFLGGPSGGEVGGAAIRDSVAATVAGINGLFGRLGSTDRIDAFWAKLEQSEKGRGGVFSGGMLASGSAFGESSWESGTSRTLSADEAISAFALDLQQATVQAIQAAADIPSAVADVARGIDAEALTQEQVGGLLQTIEAIVQVTDAMGVLGLTAAEVTTAMLTAAGGAESLASAAAAYYQGYHTEGERVGKLAEQLASQFAGLGLEMPATRDEFRALVESLDLTTASGQAAYGSLLTLSEGFGVVADYTAKLAEVVVEDVSEAVETVDQALARLRGTTRGVEDIARSILDLEAQLFAEANAGNMAALRERELAGLTAAEQALLQQIWGIQDARESEAAAMARIVEAEAEAARAAADEAQRAQAAMQAAASAMARVASERYQIETRLLTLQGDTATLRARELAQLDPSNRALQEQVWALEDQAAAAQRASAAASQARSEWERLTDSIVDEVRRIRGEVAGSSTMGYAQAQSQFALARAQASAGDRAAMEALPELARTMLDLAEANASTLVELQRIRAQTAGSLASLPGVRVPSYDVGTNYVPRDMLAMLHQGEAVVPRAYNPAAGGASSTDRELLAAIRALDARLARLEQHAAGTAQHTERSARVLDDAARGKAPLMTEAS